MKTQTEKHSKKLALSKKSVAANSGAASVADFLKLHFRRLQDANPRFSLRSLAAKINMSPGGLSQIMNGNKRLSLDRALTISKLMNLSDREADFLIQLVQADSISNQASRIKWLDQLSEDFPEFHSIRNLEVDQFRLISDWYGLAIIQWITHFNHRCSAAEMARVFNIKVSDVNRTIERLCQLEIIEKTGPASFKILTDRIEIKSQIPSDVLQNYYRSLIPLIDERISTQTPNQRVIGAEVMAFDESQIDEVRELSDQFLVALQKIAKKSKNKKSVYQAFFNFFKLNQDKI